MNLLQKFKKSFRSSENGSPKNGNGVLHSFDFSSSILDLLSQPVAYILPDYTYKYVNHSYAEWFGKSTSDILGRHIKTILGKDAFQHIRPLLEKALNGIETKLEDKLYFKNSERYIEAVYTPDRGYDGKVLGVVLQVRDITFQKQHEQLLIQNQEEVKDYIENAAIGLHWVNEDGIIIWANQAELDMMGYEKEEYIGQPISNFHASSEAINDILIQLKNKQSLNQYEAKLRTKNGDIRDVLITSNVLWKENKFIHTRCFTNDITERKKLEEALKNSEQNFRQIFSQAPVAFSIYKGKDFVVEFANEFSLNLIGVKEEDILNKSFFDLYPELEEQGIREIANMVYTTGERFVAKEYYLKYHVKDELKYGWFNGVMEPLRDKDGKIFGIVSMSSDITDLVESRIKIEEKEKKYSSLLQGIPHAIYTCNKAGEITYFNENALKIWGVEADKVTGCHYCNFEKIWLADGTCVPVDETPMGVAIKTGKSFFNTEVQVETKKGEQLYLLVNINPTFDEEGNPDGAINIFQDITDRKLMEKELSESEKRYKQLIYSLPAAIYTTDKKGVITLYNDAAAELWGRRPEIGKDLWCGSWKIFELDGITEIPLDECPMAVCLNESRKVLVTDSYIVERPDGSRRHFQPFPEPILDSDGNMIGAINMLFDVSNRKIGEEQQARLAAIVESSEDAIYSTTTDGIVLSWNKGAERLFGYSAQEIVGQPVYILDPEDKKAEINSATKKLLEESLPSYYLETKKLKKIGELVDIFLSVSIIKDPHGNITGISRIARDISVQKQLVRDLLENEDRLRMAIETTMIGTWEQIPSTRKIIWSDSCKNIYGISLDSELDIDEVTKQNHPDDEEYIRSSVLNAMDPASDGSFSIEYRIYRVNDNALRWIKVKGKVLFNSDGNADRFIGTMLDITDQKEKDQHLKDSIELFSEMAENVPAMIWMSGDDKFSDYFNKTWLAFTGRTVEEEKNEQWLQNVHPDDVQKCIDSYYKSFNEQKGFYTEYRLRRHDGEYRWIADNSVPRVNNKGEFAGFISACMDIDDQKRFSDKISESELMLNTISNVSPVGLWMTDVDGQCNFVNETWKKWTGLEFKENLGAGWLQVVLDEDRQDAHTKFMTAMQNKIKYTAEFRFKSYDGEIRWCLTEGFPFYGITGDFAGYAGSVTDITDFKRMETRKDDFIKMASHELKTPITSIKGYVQLLINIYEEINERKFQSSRSLVKSSLQTIERQVSKLTRLVSELLDLTRIESGKLELNKSEFNLSDLVEEIVQEVRLTTASHAIVIFNDLEKSFFGDKDRIAQALLNLLTNAIKYSPESNLIEVTVEEKNKNAILKVKDYGIGIDVPDQLMIFERFYRVEGKSEQTFPGFGIGLFIVSEIISRHNGTISVTSEKGKGAEFIIKLPFIKKNESI